MGRMMMSTTTVHEALGRMERWRGGGVVVVVKNPPTLRGSEAERW